MESGDSKDPIKVAAKELVWGSPCKKIIQKFSGLICEIVLTCKKDVCI